MAEHRELLIEAYNRLRDLNNSFNLARLLMHDPELRKESGEMVKENREFLERLSVAIVFKDGAVPSGGTSL